jgi:hypothetical protein
MHDEGEDPRRVGRDEMNLCEFPIATLTDYPPEGVKTLVFEDRQGTLTVVGSDDYGLPTAPDSDVIVGLIQLTKLRRERSERIGVLARLHLSVPLADNRRFPIHPLQGERPCPSGNPANGEGQRRPHNNRGIASRKSGPRSRMSSGRSRPNAARGA